MKQKLKKRHGIDIPSLFRHDPNQQIIHLLQYTNEFNSIDLQIDGFILNRILFFSLWQSYPVLHFRLI